MAKAWRRNLSRIMNEYKSKHFPSLSHSLTHSTLYGNLFYSISTYERLSVRERRNRCEWSMCCEGWRKRNEKNIYLKHFFKQCAFNSVRSASASRYELRFQWRIFAIYNTSNWLFACLSAINVSNIDDGKVRILHRSERKRKKFFLFSQSRKKLISNMSKQTCQISNLFRFSSWISKFSRHQKPVMEVGKVVVKDKLTLWSGGAEAWTWEEISKGNGKFINSSKS